MGTSSIVEPETYAPTGMWLGVSLVVGGLSYTIGGWIGRKIGRANMASYVLMGIVAVLTAISFATSAEPDTSKMPAPKMNMNAFNAMFWAGINAPGWLKVASPIVSLIGIALGGLSKEEHKPSQDQRIA